MDYQYVGYTGDKKLVKGKVAAPDEEKAVGQLNSMVIRSSVSGHWVRWENSGNLWIFHSRPR